MMCVVTSTRLCTPATPQAGDKVKAMKALLRSGDTEKIVFFTGKPGKDESVSSLHLTAHFGARLRARQHRRE
jgi:hypothetical protein